MRPFLRKRREPSVDIARLESQNAFDVNQCERTRFVTVYAFSEGLVVATEKGNENIKEPKEPAHHLLDLIRWLLGGETMSVRISPHRLKCSDYVRPFCKAGLEEDMISQVEDR